MMAVSLRSSGARAISVLRARATRSDPLRGAAAREADGELMTLADARHATRSGTRLRDTAPSDRLLDRAALRALRVARTPAGALLPAAWEAALQHLFARHVAIASELAPEPHASHARIPGQASVSAPLTPCRIHDSYLEQIIFFRHFNQAEITAVRDSLSVVSASRDTRIDIRSTLWIVLRGAVQWCASAASGCR